eukprot:gene12311-14253_t
MSHDEGAVSAVMLATVEYLCCTRHHHLLVLVSSLLATGWSTLTEQRALRVVSAAQVSVLLSLEPLFATFFAYALLGENVGTNTALAAVFIVTASLWGPVVEKMGEWTIERRKNIPF